jgi:hypothetical protein
MRKRILQEEPSALNGAQRYRLSDDEEKLLLNYREQKRLITLECAQAGIDEKDVRHYWYKSKVFSMFVKPNAKSLEDLKTQLIANMDKHSPKYPKITYKKHKEAFCLVIDPADVHIGKLSSEYETGEKYNTKIAIQRVKDSLDDILSYTQNCNIDQIVLLLGNDILHTDNTKRTTTSGTPQDTDGMWYDNFLAAQELYVYLIERLMQIAPIHCLHSPSNHDFMTGWYLAKTTEAWFRTAKQITFDVSMRHRKAYVYHENLIGATHGDGAKQNDLPILMAHEFKKEWAITKHHYIYTHHIHHKIAKDYIGVTVESSRSVSGADSWHKKYGFSGGVQAMEAYLHHKVKGQIARYTAIS